MNRFELKLIDKTLILADKYLKRFGFTEEQIVPLLIQAEKDLCRTLDKIYTMLHEEQIDHIALEQALHALKGLLSHLGNTALADRLTETLAPKDIKELLFIPT